MSPRFKILAAAFLVSASPALSAEPALRGIETADMDRAADACTDFFQFANGEWRKQNPIPPSMVRWSRRWAAGEVAKDQLKVILDDISAKTTWAPASVEQLIGDHYASCMDEARVDQLGLTPVKPLLSEIDALRDIAGVQRMIGRLYLLNIEAPFGVAASPDNQDPNQIIADIYASGLGLPDRDYYFKPEPRFAEAREKYHAHLANIFKLAGYTEADAKAAAETAFGFETKLAEASLDRTTLRDPKATDHKTTFADL